MDLSDIYHGNMVDGSFQHLKDAGSHFVPGDGNPNARVMFVGEAPGAVEDKRRLPFQGPSGRILNEHLRSIGLERDQVFVTNVLKYQPPQNRDPFPSELRDCIMWLTEEILSVNPSLIVLMGRIPTKAFFPGQHFYDLVGRLIVYPQGNKALITYHPAALLYEPSLRKRYREHFGLIRKELDIGRGDPI